MHRLLFHSSLLLGTRRASQDLVHNAHANAASLRMIDADAFRLQKFDKTLVGNIPGVRTHGTLRVERQPLEHQLVSTRHSSILIRYGQ
jgi:hypothetical protein